MKTILLATFATLILAAPVSAAGFPERAESRVVNTNKVYVADAMVKLPLKRMDQISHTSAKINFGSTQALAVGVDHLPLKAMDR